MASETLLQQGYLETIHIVNWLLDEKDAWRKLYCRLTPDVLCFFDSERDALRLTSIQESILIDDIKSVQLFRRRVSITDPTAAAVLYQTSSSQTSSAQEGKDSLTPILQDPQRLKEFIKYTEAIYSPESIKFLLAVEEFKKLEERSQEQKSHAVEIVLHYLVPQSVLELSTIPSEIREEAAEAIDEGKVNRNIFQRLTTITIASLQVNEVPAFLRYLSQVGENRQRLASVQFRIETYGGNGHSGLVAEAPSEEDCRRWISALQSACVKRKRNSQQQAPASRMLKSQGEDIREHGVVVQSSLSMRGVLLTHFGVEGSNSSGSSGEDLKGEGPKKRWWVLVQHKYRPKLVFYKPDSPKIPEGTLYCEDITRVTFLENQKKQQKNSSRLPSIDESAPLSHDENKTFVLQTISLPPNDVITLTAESSTEAQTWVGLLSARIQDHRKNAQKKEAKGGGKRSNSGMSAVITRKATVSAEIRETAKRAITKRPSQSSNKSKSPLELLPRSKSAMPPAATAGSHHPPPPPPPTHPPPATSSGGSPSRPPPPSPSRPPPSHRHSPSVDSRSSSSQHHPSRSNRGNDMSKSKSTHRRIFSDSINENSPSPSPLTFSPLTPKQGSPSSSRVSYSKSTSRISPDEPPPPPPPSTGSDSDDESSDDDEESEPAPYPASPIVSSALQQATRKQASPASPATPTTPTTPPKRPSIRPLVLPSSPSTGLSPPPPPPTKSPPLSPPLPPPSSPPLPPPTTAPPPSFPSPTSSALPRSISKLPHSTSASQLPRSGSKIPRSASTIAASTSRSPYGRGKPTHERASSSSVSQLRQSIGLNLNEIEMLHKMGALPTTDIEVDPDLSLPQFYDIPTQSFEGFLRMQDLDPSRPYEEQVKNPWHRRYLIFKPDRFTPAVLIYDNIQDRDQGKISATIYCEDIEDVQVYKGDLVASLGTIATKRQRPKRQMTTVARDSITLQPNARPQSMTVVSREARPSFVRGSSRDRCRFDVVTKMGVIPLLGDTYSDTQKWVKLLSACKKPDAASSSNNGTDLKSAASKNWQCPICFIIFLPSTLHCERCGGLKPNSIRNTLSSASFSGSGLRGTDNLQDEKKQTAPSSPTSPKSRPSNDVISKEGILKKKSDRNRHVWNDRYFCFYDDPIAPYVIFFKNVKAKEAGEISGTIYCSEIVRVNRMITGVGSQEKVRFDIETADRVYSLKAPTAKECRLWVDLISFSVTRQGFTLERGFSASEIRHHARPSGVALGSISPSSPPSSPPPPPPPALSSPSYSPSSPPRPPLSPKKDKKDKKQDLHTYSRELWKKSLPTELEGWLRKQARISRHLWNKRYFQFLNERTGEDEDNIVLRPKLQYFKSEKLKQQGHMPKAWLYCDQIKSVHISRRGGGKLSQERCRFDVETTTGAVWSLIADSYKVCLSWVHLLSYHASQALLSKRISTGSSPASSPKAAKKVTPTKSVESKHKPKASLQLDPHVRLISGVKQFNGRIGDEEELSRPIASTPSTPRDGDTTLTRSLPSAGQTPVHRSARGVGTAPVTGHEERPEVGSRGEPVFVAGSNRSGYA